MYIQIIGVCVFVCPCWFEEKIERFFLSVCLSVCLSLSLSVVWAPAATHRNRPGVIRIEWHQMVNLVARTKLKRSQSIYCTCSELLICHKYRLCFSFTPSWTRILCFLFFLVPLWAGHLFFFFYYYLTWGGGGGDLHVDSHSLPCQPSRCIAGTMPLLKNAQVHVCNYFKHYYWCRQKMVMYNGKVLKGGHWLEADAILPCLCLWNRQG